QAHVGARQGRGIGVFTDLLFYVCVRHCIDSIPIDRGKLAFQHFLGHLHNRHSRSSRRVARRTETTGVGLTTTGTGRLWEPAGGGGGCCTATLRGGGLYESARA